MSDTPIWPCSGTPELGAYEEGIACKRCKVRFGIALVMSNGKLHQWIESFTCTECAKKFINKDYGHAKPMLEWLNGKEEGP